MPYYNPYMTQMQMPVQSPQTNNGLIWVQGEAGAKSYMVPPNSTVMLMDSENQQFFLKSTDVSGMPQPLRVFEYTEKPQNAPNKAPVAQSIDYSSFVTKAELEAFKAQIEALVKGGRKDGQSTVPRAKQEPEG